MVDGRNPFFLLLIKARENFTFSIDGNYAIRNKKIEGWEDVQGDLKKQPTMSFAVNGTTHWC